MANNSLIQMPDNFGVFKLGDQNVALTPELIKQNFGANLTDIEIYNFGWLCQQNDLNPFTRESFVVKYGNSPASLIIAKQGLANRAERSGHLKSKRGGIIETRQNPKTGEWETKDVAGSFIDPGYSLYGAWAVIERDDRSEPFEERVLFTEYNNPSNPLWKSKPTTMCAKVAMQHCLREAFPCTLPNGTYYEEEFSDDLNPNRRSATAKTVSNFSEEAEVIEEVVDPETGEIKTSEPQQ